MWRSETHLQGLPYMPAWAHTSTKTDSGFLKWNIFTLKHDLTNKLRRSKNVLEFVSRFDLMSDPKINQLDPGVGDVLVQQHDILRLKD